MKSYSRQYDERIPIARPFACSVKKIVLECALTHYHKNFNNIVTVGFRPEE